MNFLTQRTKELWQVSEISMYTMSWKSVCWALKKSRHHKMDSNCPYWVFYLNCYLFVTPSKDYRVQVGKPCSKHSHFPCLHVQVSDSEDTVRSTCTKWRELSFSLCVFWNCKLRISMEMVDAGKSLQGFTWIIYLMEVKV